MTKFLHIVLYDWKNLWRSHSLKILLAVFLGAGIYGIYFGKFEIDKQQVHIETVEKLERQKFDSLILWVALDTSLEANKFNYEKAVSPTGAGWSMHFQYYFANQASPLAGLCLGQRDLYPVYYGIEMTDLTRQTNIGELANPLKLLTGNFDLSYVIIFLLPLLLMTLFYDLYASEKEGGTLSLLQTQSTSLTFILLSKGILRLMIVWVLSTFLLLLGFVLQAISIVENIALLFQWLLVIYTYSLFWVALMTAIIALKQSSALSAILGLGVWLLFTLILPAFINLLVSAYAPLPNRTEINNVIRTLNDQNWESPKSFVLDKFYADYPEYSQSDTTNFDKWYYATFVILDDGVASLQAEIETQINQRNLLLQQWQYLAPSAWAYEQLSKLSGTNRESHLEFMQQVKANHESLKKIYFKRIFQGEKFTLQDLKELEKKLTL